jgi:hypothetical protein
MRRTRFAVGAAVMAIAAGILTGCATTAVQKVNPAWGPHGQDVVYRNVSLRMPPGWSYSNGANRCQLPSQRSITITLPSWPPTGGMPCGVEVSPDYYWNGVTISPIYTIRGGAIGARQHHAQWQIWHGQPAVITSFSTGNNSADTFVDLPLMNVAFAIFGHDIKSNGTLVNLIQVYARKDLGVPQIARSVAVNGIGGKIPKNGWAILYAARVATDHARIDRVLTDLRSAPVTTLTGACRKMIEDPGYEVPLSISVNTAHGNSLYTVLGGLCQQVISDTGVTVRATTQLLADLHRYFAPPPGTPTQRPIIIPS